MKTTPPSCPESAPLKLGDDLFDKALTTPVASSRYQQLDRALGHCLKAMSGDLEDFSIKIRCTSTRFLAAGRSAKLLAAAKADAVNLLLSANQSEVAEALHARAVAITVQGDLDAAHGAYVELATHPDSGTEELAKARYLARHMARANGWAFGSLDDAFPPLQLVVLAGHLPPKVDLGCQKLIADELARLGATIGVASAAAGADLLFLDSLHSRGGKSHIILPWSQDSFRETSILPFRNSRDGAVWEKLFDDALENSASVREIGEVVGLKAGLVSSSTR